MPNAERNMNFADRFKTFEKWPLAYVSPQSLAEAGYIYTGTGDEVKCVVCNVVHFNWMMGDKPMFEHRRSNPNCSYAAMRFATYADWPGWVTHRANDMARAGFFFMEAGEDRVRCFCCGRKLEKWTVDDDPWIEHAKFEPDCAYLIEKKGHHFIYDVQKLHNMDTMKWSRGPKTDEVEYLVALAKEDGYHYTYLIKAVQQYKHRLQTFRELKDLINAAKRIKARITDMRLDEQSQLDKDCSVCLDKKVSLCFTPCGHAICCDVCAKRLRECPLCRKRVTGKIKLFFA
ncbi:baculoviral IAP repeat-containing protein 3-like [Paramacrobiotus metropolitanus]|uniref:baculoviral IAP repeat-containing protein 3-like n=1 Tax=Paramacrobiotus metropolitanus TaxID=2943436 RepID=UPI002446515D|nr:baculoviral IAP repeat-containing protein 3-like [Paramacrobiotus metropolitanus]